MEESDVRTSMLGFSKNSAVQYLLSIVTGKALPKQQPLYDSGAAIQFASTLLFLAAGVVGSFVIVNYLPLYLIVMIIPAWLLTVAGARKFQAEIQHQISHDRFSENVKVDRVVSDVMTTILWIQDYVSYKADHQNHHGTNLATTRDPDAAFLFYLGFKPGMTESQLWRRLLVTLISPKFYLLFFGLRMKANFIDAPVHRIVLSAVWLMVLAMFAAGFGLTFTAITDRSLSQPFTVCEA